jgi:hypothetical protein
MDTKSSRAAEALFRKKDQEAAMSEYDQRRNAEQEKTAKLRALRLAKEAAAAKKPAAKKSAAKKPAAKKPAAKARRTATAKHAVSA